MKDVVIRSPAIILVSRSIRHAIYLTNTVGQLLEVAYLLQDWAVNIQMLTGKREYFVQNVAES